MPTGTLQALNWYAAGFAELAEERRAATGAPPARPGWQRWSGRRTPTGLTGCPDRPGPPGGARAGGRVSLVTTVLTRAHTVLPRGIFGGGGREKEKCPLAYSHPPGRGANTWRA